MRVKIKYFYEFIIHLVYNFLSEDRPPKEKEFMHISPMKTSTHPESTCCQKAPASETAWLKRVDLICRIAIGIFGAYIAPLPLLISFAIGSIVGAVYTATRYLQNKPMYPDGQSKPVCAQGYMDFLSGMRFPPLIGTLATTSFIAAHMRHDPLFYAPFCGLFLGFWIGREGTAVCHTLAGRFYQPIKPAHACCHQI